MFLYITDEKIFFFYLRGGNIVCPAKRKKKNKMIGRCLIQYISNHLFSLEQIPADTTRNIRPRVYKSIPTYNLELLLKKYVYLFYTMLLLCTKYCQYIVLHRKFMFIFCKCHSMQYAKSFLLCVLIYCVFRLYSLVKTNCLKFCFQNSL